MFLYPLCIILCHSIRNVHARVGIQQDLDKSLAKFDFHPFVDSGGGDIGRLEGGVENYAKVCSSNSACLGFNSNGWYKNVLKPKSQWGKWTSDHKQGFYTKKTDELSLVNVRANSCEDNAYEVKGVGCLPKLDRGGKIMVYMHQKKQLKQPIIKH